MACKARIENNTTDTAANKAQQSKTPADSIANNTPHRANSFDINSIPVSNKDLGTFPYIIPPSNYAYNYSKTIQPGDINDTDKEYFAVNGKLIAQEGKSYKAHIDRDAKDGKRFNSLEVGKYFDDLIKSLGGVQVNNVAVPKAQIDSVGNDELVTKKYGNSIDYNMLNDIKTYVIRTRTKQVWIQMTLMNEESGKITVLENKAI